MRSTLSRRLFLAVALVAIAVATLRPLPGQPSVLWLSCLACGAHGVADMLLNVMLFMPLGAALAVCGVKVSRATLWGALLAASIEVAQLYIPGRNLSLGDVVANTAGTAVGAALMHTARVWLVPARHASRLSHGAALTAAALCVLTGVLLTPAFPISRYYGQWTPNLAHLQWYRGRVRAATLSGLRIPPGPLPDPQRVRALLLSDSGFVLHVRAVAGPRPSGLAPLFAIYDNRRREMLLVGPDGGDLVFRIRTRAAAARLDHPDIRVTNGLQHFAPGDSLDVRVNVQNGAYQIAINDERYGPLGFSVGDGWALLLYAEALAAPFRAALGALWVAVLFLPAGFWVRTRREALFAGAGLATGLLAAPALTPLATTPVAQWAGAAAGLLAGFGLHVVISRRLSAATAPHGAHSEVNDTTNTRTQRSIQE
jgi:VanZ family protein